MNSLLELIQTVPIVLITAITPITNYDPPQRCNANIQMAQATPDQQWCCCGSCCNWAVSCDAIPGCDSC